MHMERKDVTCSGQIKRRLTIAGVGITAVDAAIIIAGVGITAADVAIITLDVGITVQFSHLYSARARAAGAHMCGRGPAAATAEIGDRGADCSGPGNRREKPEGKASWPPSGFL